MQHSTILCVALLALGTTSSGASDENLPGMTYESVQSLPHFSGWWNMKGLPIEEFGSNPPPMRAEDLARIRTSRAQDSDPDPRRYCRPQEFAGFSGGFVDSVEFLFTPGRVTLTNESGLVRRIYTDGQSLPAQVEMSNTGISLGHWEGDTLVVKTTRINPDAHYPRREPGAPRIGKNVEITERISLKDENTLEIDLTTVAPDVLTRPDHRTRVYTRAKKQMAREVSFCVDQDRSLDARTGKQRFDMTPPADLPPPPPQQVSAPAK